MAALLAEKFNLPASAAVWSGDYAVPPEADILIHATSLGQDDADAPLPLVPESLRPELLVADATAGGPETWLLRQAAARGCKTVDGLSMFLEQVAVGPAALDRRRSEPPGVARGGGRVPGIVNRRQTPRNPGHALSGRATRGV